MSVNRSSTTTTSTEVPSGPGDLILTRTFDAPRQLVWQAWTDPAHLTQWWGPHEFTAPVCELDVRPGGTLLIHMRGPDGTMYPMRGVFLEVVEPERLVFSSIVQEDEEGNVQLEVLTTVTLTERSGKTELTLRAAVVKATPAAAGPLAGMEEGWKQSLDKLGSYLARERVERGRAVMPRPVYPDLKDLEVLVGTWMVEGSLVEGSFPASFEWLQDGAFLLYRLGDKTSGLPYAACVIGRDDAAETYTVLYSDDRGVSRVYHMSLEGGEWKQWREAPDFCQRFLGRFSEDGNTITARWEKSRDGTAWEHDFDLTYTRVS